MFKAARWRSEKNRTKAVFKLQFHATQVLQLESEPVMVSLVPVDSGRPTARSEKVMAVDGACNWENPVYESVKLVRGPKHGKMDEKVYKFVVSAAGSSKAEILGEASINLADYAEVLKPSSVALPLKGSSTGAILHITIQRMQGDGEGREGDEEGEAMVKRQRRTLQSQLGKWDEDDSHINNQARVKFPSSRDIPLHNADSKGNLHKSNSFDAISASGSDTSSGIYTPRDNGIKHNNMQRDSTTFLSPLTRMFSSDDFSGTSAPDGSADASTSSSGDGGLNETSRDSEDSVEKLKSDLEILTRKLEVSDLELQTLRKQVIKENKRGIDLSRELSSVKEERDTLKRECEELKISEKRRKFSGILSTELQHDGEDHLSLLEEIKQELDHEKNLNVHLRLQIKMMQEANSELMLAVKDLDVALEQKTRETLCTKCSKMDLKTEIGQELEATEMENGFLQLQKSQYKQLPETDSQNDIEEQYALDALVNEHDGMKISYSLENKIIDLNNEVEFYRKDREDLEMQMEQLALDYEILKQENHDITTKLEQMQLREQLRMQYECSAHLAIIGDLESNVECLEKELQKQAEAFEEDIAAMMQAKIEQEKRAILAEEALRKTKWNHANNAEQLQEGFKSLSAHMLSTFQANEKILMQKLKENAELLSHKSNLEELLEKSNKNLILLQDQYRMKFKQLLGLVDFKSKEVDRLTLELKDKKKELEDYKVSEEARKNSFFEELQLLNTEMEKLKLEKSLLSEQNVQKAKLLMEMELLRITITESEKSLQEKILEIDFIKKEETVLKAEVSTSLQEITELRHIKNEKESIIAELKSEATTLGQQCNDLKHALHEYELGRENLQKPNSHSRCMLLEENQITNSLEEEIDGNYITTITKDDEQSHDSSEYASKDEVDCSREYLQQSKEDKNCKDDMNGTGKKLLIRFAGPNSDEDDKFCDYDQKEIAEALSEMEVLKEQNKSMGYELKEMQERYSEISLKFAEVEGERQQLLMTIRSLKNASKN
ncbi:hypothetical protein Cni_G14577 [Canna indica]|uniref:C2 NT-type domain-containing protein n=1 Tax=Canna indica TaxID=4628 RepID=A0AAQ3KI31_9LILI|nr:hypothetical protein Cni_G14577 [Canna indica]